MAKDICEQNMRRHAATTLLKTPIQGRSSSRDNSKSKRAMEKKETSS